MTVAFDAFTATNWTFPGTSCTRSHTPVGTPTSVAVIVYQIPINGATITAVTYGGVTCTRKDIGGPFIYTAVSIWGLANPPAGAQNAVVTLNTSDYFGVSVVTVTGGDTTTPFSNSGNTGANSGSDSTVVTNSAVGELVLEATISHSGILSSPGSGQTVMFNTAQSSWVHALSRKNGASPTVTTTWHINNPAEYSAVAVSFKDAGGGGTTYPVSLTEGSATVADTPDRYVVQFTFPGSDIAANGWLPSTGGSLYAVLDETTASFSDYIYSPNNPTTQQFEVKFNPVPDAVLTSGYGMDIYLQASGFDTNFDFDLVEGTTVRDSWTELVTVAQGQVIRTHNFSSAVIAAITDYSNLRLRGVARA